MRRNIKINKFLLITIITLTSMSVIACENDLNKAQSKFVDKFYSCQRELENRASSAMKCFTVVANDLAVFAGHKKQSLLLADFYYASGLVHTAMGYPKRAVSDFNASLAIEPHSAIQERLEHWQERDNWDKQELLVQARKISINRINILRNPRIKDRVLRQHTGPVKDSSSVHTQTKITVPDRDARNVIFADVGVSDAISLAGFDELDQDMLFMKSARLTESLLINTYQSQFDVKKLRALVKLSKHYYGIGQ